MLLLMMLLLLPVLHAVVAAAPAAAAVGFHVHFAALTGHRVLLPRSLAPVSICPCWVPSVSAAFTGPAEIRGNQASSKVIPSGGRR